MKTHKGTAKRVKITAGGKITRKRASGGHLLAKKSKSRKRAINTTGVVTGGMAKNIKKVLGLKGVK